MQTLINVLALSSFAVSAALVGGGFYAYSNKDAIIESVKENIMGELLPGELSTDVNSIPSVGGDSPLPSLPTSPF